jgi:hypothetical protein
MSPIIDISHGAVKCKPDALQIGAMQKSQIMNFHGFGSTVTKFYMTKFYKRTSSIYFHLAGTMHENSNHDAPCRPRVIT